MTLGTLLKDMEIRSIKGSTDVLVNGVAYDSRKVSRGDVFVAIRGERFDGRDFIADALRKGACAVVLEGDAPEFDIPGNPTLVGVEDCREALAHLSANFFGRPSEFLTMVGVTGTNGKTTTTYLIKSILESSDRSVGLVGTINYMIKDKTYPSPHTTPESLEFQGLLRKMLQARCSHAVAEVSSHALALKRVNAARFDVAVFTNLTREHLDFHLDMEDYFRAKLKLFGELLRPGGSAVINTEDPYGKTLYSMVKGKVNALSYGIEGEPDFKALNLKSSFEGVSFDIRHEGDMHRVESKLVGSPNVYNILAAAAAARAMAMTWDEIKTGIEKLTHVKGRFERVDAGQDFLCIVDYAHTPDALERLILNARQMSGGGRIITVFGCGGDRDRGKRPQMGRIAAALSDFAFITSDNPRSEDPLAIIKDIEEGIREGDFRGVPDRGQAISLAVEMAASGDIVLIAGKGHEEHQEVKGIRYPMSDASEAEAAIRRKLRGARGGDAHED